MPRVAKTDDSPATVVPEVPSPVVIHFVEQPPAGARVLREFTEPRHVFAVKAPGATTPGEVGLQVRFVESPSVMDDGRSPSGDVAGTRPVVLKRGGEIVRWARGAVEVVCSEDRRAEWLVSLIEFAYLDGELTRLESAVEARADQADADVAVAYRISHRDKKHWDRFKQTIEFLARLRLTLERLKPLVHTTGRAPGPSGRLVSALLRKADVAGRLERLDERLEVFEDLYEGANDRVADYRWYRGGHLLELTIVALLLIEAVLISFELYMHYDEYGRDQRHEERAAAYDYSEEIDAVITRVSDGDVTFHRPGAGDEITLPTTATLKVHRGRIDRTTRELRAGAPIDGGLKNGLFARVGAEGLRATIVTDPESKKIAEIYVMPGPKK